MNAKIVLVAAMTALSLAAPVLAHADSDDWRGDRGAYSGHYDGERGRDWQGARNDWRGGERRDDGYGWNRRDYGARAYRWGHERRCWVENRGYYEPDGDYISRPIRVCR